jgi:1-deoxy-D-xylulose-5-phosphate synthase
VRYPRGRGLGVPLDEGYKEIPIGASEVLREGRDMVIFAIGTTVAPSLQAASDLAKEGLDVGVVNCRFVKPLDARLAQLAAPSGRVLVAEENARQGGLGGAVLELLNDLGMEGIRLARIGLPDQFIEHGPIELLREKYGLDKAGITRGARDLCRESEWKKGKAGSAAVGKRSR